MGNNKNTMRRYLVGGNWKSNGTMKFAKDFSADVLNNLKFDPSKVDVLVCPTALHIPAVQAAVGNNVNVGVQNVSLTGNGAFTGELSCEMVTEMGLKWTLTGHS